MNQKRLVYKLLALVACLMCALGASAAEAYACYTSSDKTLTFYYDNYRSSRPGTTYDMNTGYSTPAWFLDTHETLVAVTFDATFKNARPTSTYSWFYTMPNLRRINNIGNLNTSSVTVMQNMFNGCSSLYYLDLSNFNTANVTDMSIMFSDCSNLTVIDLSGFNTSKVTSMGSMFQNCSNLTTIYAGSGWNTVALTNSGFMFRNCTSLVGGQGTTYQSSNPANKTYAHIDGGPSNPGYFTDGSAPMPYACYTSSNKTLTFYYDTQRRSRTGTTYFMNTRDIRTGWYIDDLNANVTKVVFNSSFADARPTSMYMWFYEMFSLQSITGINYLNTSEVTNMAFTFSNCEKLTSLDVSHFNTDKVTTMQYMFVDCQKLTSLDMSSFNTAGVTDMEGLFSDCNNLTTIYAGNGWNTDAVTVSNTAYMFSDCYRLVGGQGTAYNENHTGKDYAHIDGGPSNPGYFTAGTEAYACYTPSNTTLTFYYDNKRYSRPGTTYDLNTGDNDPGWYRDKIYENATQVIFDPSFEAARPTSTFYWFFGMSKLSSITGIEYLNTSEVTNMYYMFGECSAMSSLDVSNFNTSKVINMAGMFESCSGLTSLDLSNFDTSNVTDMNNMFILCKGLTSLDLSNFDTSNVTDMKWMFFDCRGLTSLDLSSFNTANVTDMRRMFNGCDNLASLDVSHFNTSKVTNMGWMFGDCSSLKNLDLSSFNTSQVTVMEVMFYHCSGLTSLDVSNFNTTNLTNMSFMFSGCSGLTSLDLSNFNTSKVTSMSYMFEGCSNLATIYAGNGWSTAAVATSSNMFNNCTSLVGGHGTTYDANHIDKEYAHIDGGPSYPGYFTSKSQRGDVNCDGLINIDDVTDLINYLLTGNDSNVDLLAADCYLDGRINIDDVTALINYLLSNKW